MKLAPSAHCTSREEWRDWLQEHHASRGEVWLHYFKKHTGKPSISYRDSVEEALCFGWIDGLKRRVDDERYAHRFTPRKEKSKWSPLNIRLAQEMIAQGKMTEAGLAAFNKRIAYEEEFLEKRDKVELPAPEKFKKALQANPIALKNFKALAPGYRKQFIGWITSAKREETRSKRTIEAVHLLEQNKKLGMK